jgi:decaprenyl-phosphate phosphoribosyltransferase
MPEDSATTAAAQKGNWLEYVRVMRLDHWLKNIFILFGHAVAIALVELPIDGALIVKVILSLIPACLVASANYILNEILDAPFDRLHPTKKLRAVAAGTVSIPLLYGLMVGLNLLAVALCFLFQLNWAYLASLGLLFLSGLVYNIPPVRLKDRAFLDVIAESFNNPIRLWLGWYALCPPDSFPPLSVILAWWSFGALLMTGKRYAEYRFIDNPELSGRYRKSFQVYKNHTLIISMVTYANVFCFCMGAAITTYEPNLIFAFPIIVVAIIIYFAHAMSEKNARLVPEQLMKNPLLIVATVVTMLWGLFLVWTPVNLPEKLHFFRLIPGESRPAAPQG